MWCCGVEVLWWQNDIDGGSVKEYLWMIMFGRNPWWRGYADTLTSMSILALGEYQIQNETYPKDDRVGFGQGIIVFVLIPVI